MYLRIYILLLLIGAFHRCLLGIVGDIYSSHFFPINLLSILLFNNMRHSNVKLPLLVNFILFVIVCLYIHGYPRRPKRVSDSLSSPQMVVSHQTWVLEN